MVIADGAPPELIAAAAHLDAGDEGALSELLARAGRGDPFTLWNLLPGATREAREKVLRRMEELKMRPAKVKREALLAGRPEALLALRIAATDLNTISTAAPVDSPAPPPPGAAPGAPSPAQDPALLALRDELDGTSPDAAAARIAHFRPLCDSDGYPLVGNLVRKGPTYGPTAFCASLRDRPAPR